ncbi:hypothetical protein EGW08_002827 [Elysia chlorotica]|uniref:Uncharacterized protein n=1 Tax=Elysia chlorotica TaxID=188477 RepID=A0A3S1HZR2_ELYCH|nr:hypothetical protein EGW08_002827 [Elysia chlorotica]
MSSSSSSYDGDTQSDVISGGADSAFWEGPASLLDGSPREQRGEGQKVKVIENNFDAEGHAEAPIYKRIQRDRDGNNQGQGQGQGRKVRFVEEGYSYRAARKMKPDRDKKRGSRNGKRRRASRRGGGSKNKLVISGDGGRNSDLTSSDDDEEGGGLAARCISLALGPSQNTVSLVGFRSLPVDPGPFRSFPETPSVYGADSPLILALFGVSPRLRLFMEQTQTIRACIEARLQI